MSKKGLTITTLIGLILVGLGFVVLFLIFTQGSIFAGEEADRQACRSSMLIASKAGVVGKLADFEVDCEQEYVEIDVEDEKELMEELATQLYRCWSYAGGGLFDSYNFFVDDDKNTCLLCSHIVFSEETQKINGGKLLFSDFYDYLQDTPLPGNSGLSYWDYLHQYNPDPNLVEDKKQQLEEELAKLTVDDSIDLSRDYTAFFSVYPKRSFEEKLEYVTGLVVSGGVGAGAIMIVYGVGAPIATGGVVTVVVFNEIIKYFNLFEHAVPTNNLIPIPETEEEISNFKEVCNYIANN